MVLAIKTLFIHSPDSFDTSKLSLFPDPLSNPNFTDDFMAYIPQDEWNHFMASSVSFIILQIVTAACYSIDTDYFKCKCCMSVQTIVKPSANRLHAPFFQKCSCPLSVCMCVVIISGVIWTPYDWLNKFYSFCMAAIVSIISRHALAIEGRHRHQPYIGASQHCISHYVTCIVI